jgi:hypothetical protein
MAICLRFKNNLKECGYCQMLCSYLILKKITASSGSLKNFRIKEPLIPVF